MPVFAVALTALLLTWAGQQRHSGLEYAPYGVTAAWALNGPAFIPTPFGSPLKVPYADRLYSVFLAWLCLGAFLDWKREHPSALLLTNLSTRLIVFGALTAVLLVLAASLAHHLLWDDGMTPQLFGVILLSTNFHTRWVTLCVLFVWLLAILIWSAANLLNAARPQPARYLA